MSRKTLTPILSTGEFGESLTPAFLAFLVFVHGVISFGQKFVYRTRRFGVVERNSDTQRDHGSRRFPG